MEKRFHITITNNETQETLIDVDTGAIVAGIDEDEGTRSIGFVHCRLPDHAAVLCALQEQINQSIEENPILGALVLGYFRQAQSDKAETTEN